MGGKEKILPPCSVPTRGASQAAFLFWVEKKKKKGRRVGVGGGNRACRETGAPAIAPGANFGPAAYDEPEKGKKGGRKERDFHCLGCPLQLAGGEKKRAEKILFRFGAIPDGAGCG